MRRILTLLTALAFLGGLFPVAATADWDEGDGHKMHWPQLPDPVGVDVNATAPQSLGDDWECSETGWVKDIHFWGSWKDDEKGTITSFTLSIYTNDPGIPGELPSKPDRLLWRTQVTQFTEREMAPSPQGWFDPIEPFYLPDNHMRYYQYNIVLPEDNWFYQVQDTIYWLVVSANVESGPSSPEWGWKSTIRDLQWMDDAVWSNSQSPWQEMYDPPQYEQSLDLAFVITGEPTNPLYKMHFPQWPDPMGWDVYATEPYILADDWVCTNGGPVKNIHFWGSWYADLLGTITSFNVAIYSDQPLNPPEIPYSRPNILQWEAEITDFIEIPMELSLQGWMTPDPGGPMVFPDNHQQWFEYVIYLPEELWFSQREGNIYWLTISATVVEPEALWGWKSSLRHWNDDAVWSTAAASWMELYEPPDFVQSMDLAFLITDGDWLDFGDAPESGPSPGYPTLLVSNGARHIADGLLFMGTLEDLEPDGLPDANALGDDLDNLDDEDGVTFTSRLVAGQTAHVDVTASNSGLLDAWIDFNGDGDWADEGEQIFASHALVSGVNSLTFPVPSTATATSTLAANKTFARFRISSAGGLSYTGMALDGEVEDYGVEVYRPAFGWLLLLLDD